MLEMKKVHPEKCPDCLTGKQYKVVFRPRPPIRRKNALELVHTDVCQVYAKPHADAQYFVTFIDDCIQKLWISTLKTKDQVFSIFKEIQERVERESGSLRSSERITEENTDSSKNIVSLKVSGWNTPC